MEPTPITTFINIREHLGLSQQQIADLAGIDVSLVEQYENGELLPAPEHSTYHEKLVLRDKINHSTDQSCR